MQVVDDVVTVLADTVIPVASLDAAKAEAELAAATERKTESEEERVAREKAIVAARAKLRLARGK